MQGIAGIFMPGKGQQHYTEDSHISEQKREGSPGGWEYHFTENKKTIPPFKDSLKVREIVKLPCIDQLV